MIIRNLQNVTIRKYGTAFLEAFGMLPLTYFGAVGDNVTDNYANIQVAITESLKRGLRYIFVPNGNYYYWGTLVNVDEIIFVGNTKYAKIFDQNNNEIKIYQMGTQVPYEKGTTVLEENVAGEGYIDIPIKTKNSSEVILVIENNVIQVIDSLILLNGRIWDDDVIYLSDTGDNNVYLSDVILGKEYIRLVYDVTGTGGIMNKNCEWRVR